MAIGNFNGFSPETIDFLWALRMNNSKAWMDENRQLYFSVLKEPMMLFAQELLAEVSKIKGAPQLTYGVSRINRDIRFSKDKSPYRARAWVVLKPEGIGQAWKIRPAFFFEISPEGYDYGCGFYDTQPAYMAALRRKIDAKPFELERLAKAFNGQDTFKFEAQMYKRPMGGEKSKLVTPWYQAKSFSMVNYSQLDDLLYSPDLPQKIAARFTLLFPLYNYFLVSDI